MEIGVLVAISDVKVACHNHHISNILVKKLKGSLVVVWVNVDSKV